MSCFFSSTRVDSQQSFSSYLTCHICLPSRGEEIENKEVIIQELEVGKEANNF
jgi:hypothetical protein